MTCNQVRQKLWVMGNPHFQLTSEAGRGGGRVAVEWPGRANANQVDSVRIE